MKNTRETAFQVIYKVLEEGEYSHVVLRQTLLLEKDAEKRDRAFVTRLVEGTLERLLTLDYILNQVSKTPVKKMKPVIRTILRMSVYQLLFMDSVPDSAVCNEAVKLVKGKGFQGLAGFVNGVLRNVARSKDKWLSDETYPDRKKTGAKYLSVRYSLPEWLCSYFVKEYGIEQAEKQYTQNSGYYPLCNIKIRQQPDHALKSRISGNQQRHHDQKHRHHDHCAQQDGTHLLAGSATILQRRKQTPQGLRQLTETHHKKGTGRIQQAGDTGRISKILSRLLT